MCTDVEAFEEISQASQYFVSQTKTREKSSFVSSLTCEEKQMKIANVILYK